MDARTSLMSKPRTVLLLLALVCVPLTYTFAAEFIAVDRCLDGGGAFV